MGCFLVQPNPHGSHAYRLNQETNKNRNKLTADDNEPILKSMHMYMYVYTHVEQSIAKNSNFLLQLWEFPVMEWPSSQHEPPQLVPGHHKGVFFSRKWDLGSLQSKYKQICAFNLKWKPQCTMQGSAKGLFLHTGDWFCKPKNIMEGSLCIPTVSFNATHSD